MSVENLDIPVADMQFDIQIMINTVYNHIDGVHDTEHLQDKFEEFDKKYNPSHNCVGINTTTVSDPS